MVGSCSPRCTRAALVADVQTANTSLCHTTKAGRQVVSDRSDCYGSQHTRRKSGVAPLRCTSAALVAVRCGRRVYVAVTHSARLRMGESDFSPLTARTSWPIPYMTNVVRPLHDEFDSILARTRLLCVRHLQRGRGPRTQRCRTFDLVSFERWMQRELTLRARAKACPSLFRLVPRSDPRFSRSICRCL